jgi:hypothetical protein
VAKRALERHAGCFVLKGVAPELTARASTKTQCKNVASSKPAADSPFRQAILEISILQFLKATNGHSSHQFYKVELNTCPHSPPV